ncbi:MAG TPA: c-type cytochrome [Novosphingobium sp.]|nr:c-type cytochrome [Novosphingobium sp.]
MRQVGRIGTALLLLAGLAGCGSKSDQPAEGPDPAASASEIASVAATDGPSTAFAQCAACHSVEPGTMGIGPSLHGVTGRKAGTLAGFAFSTPLKNSGLTWDAAGLDKWLESPLTMVPGTKMSYAGLKDPVKRKEVIEYLATLK